MWCAHCQADVATEISADGQSLKCTTCGHEIRRVFAPSLHPETQSARELLERWAREDQDETPDTPGQETRPAAPGQEAGPSAADPVAAVTPEATESAPPALSEPERPVIRHQLPYKRAEELETDSPSAEASDGSSGIRRGQAPKPFRPPVQLRLDAAHGAGPFLPAPRAPFRSSSNSTSSEAAATSGEQPVDPTAKSPIEPAKPVLPEIARKPQFLKPPVDEPATEPVAQASGGNAEQPPVERIAEASERPQPRRRLDAAHKLDVVPAPHLDMAPFIPPPRGARPGRSEALWGQLLAYAGVGVLTVGTVLVLWGYFGSIESYASTGWLLSSAGQMLLFLGVVTLVSGGMQQTTHEVGTRIESLDGRIHRIEQSTHQLLKGPHFARGKRRSRKSAGQSGTTDAKSA